MNTQVDSAVYGRALAVAENLKLKLEARLVNKTDHGWSCSCGACGAGPSRVVAVEMPTSYRYQIAMWMLWNCDMVDNTGKPWSQGISSYIPWSELYPMFRQAFAGIDVRVEHPYAQLFLSQPAPFVHSGRTVEIRSNNPVFVRPIGEVSQSVWVNAELRIDRGLEQYATDEALIACNVDALEFGQQLGRGTGHYYRLAKVGGQAFYIRIPGHGQDIHLPIAQVVAVNKEAGTATIELDQSVELFEPTQI
jgi:hypothetical protein